jgi:predicted XRE-type DNA-binding protein
MKTNHDLTEDLENTVTTGSGNVYADLGYENPDEMLLKAQLVRLLSQVIKAKGLNQYQAAEVLGIDQPKVSALVRGQFRGYSLERLFRFLNAFDLDVEVRVSRNSFWMGSLAKCKNWLKFCNPKVFVVSITNRNDRRL